jgi:hypothetical protein
MFSRPQNTIWRPGQTLLETVSLVTAPPAFKVRPCWQTSSPSCHCVTCHSPSRVTFSCTHEGVSLAVGIRGRSFTGDARESRVGTPKAEGASSMDNIYLETPCHRGTVSPCRLAFKVRPYRLSTHIQPHKLILILLNLFTLTQHLV